jgi:hypothetical protein
MTDNDFDYLVTEADEGVLQNLGKMGEFLKELKLKCLKAEAAYKDAQKELDYYSSSVLPMAMFNAGVQEISLMSGGKMAYERKFYCQPNKNDADRRLIADWLRENGGEYLIKAKASIDEAQFDKLKAAEIPYTEVVDVNTTSLKAFLKDKIGAKTGMQQIQVSDIPDCIHFQEVGQVTIEA